MVNFGISFFLLLLFLSALVRRALEFPAGELPSPAEPEIGLNGGGGSRGFTWMGLKAKHISLGSAVTPHTVH